MQVIYKYNGANTQTSSPVPLGNKGESVLIVSSEKKTTPSSDKALTLTSEAYDVEISQEALDRNAEVHRHEKAHMAALGSAAASGIMYNTMKGPHGETIAVGGKIAVDLSEVPGDPQATLSKARSIISAANAAATPSGGDMRTAAKAYGLAQKAQEDLIMEQTEDKIDILA